jgi:hypothetical protein
LKKKTLLLLKQKRPASVAVPTMRFMAVFAKQTGGCDETKVLESKEKEISPSPRPHQNHMMAVFSRHQLHPRDYCKFFCRYD